MKFRTFIISIIALLSVDGLCNNYKPILLEIDKALEQKTVYESSRSARITSMKEMLNICQDEESRNSLYSRLFGEYQFYICDSALYYAEAQLASSRLLADKKKEVKSMLDIVYVSSIMGLYASGNEYLKSIERAEIPNELLPYYFKCNIRMYENLASYDSGNMSDHYYLKIKECRDSMSSVLDHKSLEYAIVRAELDMVEGNSAAAKRSMLGHLDGLTPDSREIAFVAFTMGMACEMDNDVENQIYYYAVSALSDIRCGIKETLSLRKLAVELCEQGDTDRAYTYIKNSIDDSNFSGARIRTLEVSSMLPLIIEAYQQKKQLQRAELMRYFIITAILSIILFLCLLLGVRQFRKLSDARSALDESNHQLALVNSQLSFANQRQKELNHSLSRSNIRKEEYIGHFMNMCSSYIDKLENYKKLVNRKITSGQIDDLHKLTSSDRLVESELRDFYQSFDNTFLFIYPNFIEELNKLFKQESSFNLKPGEGLNTELRILALIKLGITDSSGIASFLRYSPQTIYNYRTKIKNRALGDRELFEQRVCEIGRA